MLLEKVKKTIEKHRMLKKGDSVLVAVSGGPDSVALFHLLLALRDEFSLKLFVGHLNHKFRREEAEKDAEFVRRLAEKKRVPAVIEEADLPALIKKRKGSPEEIARDVRYQFLVRAGRRLGAAKIALGHTRDDQAETVLMRIIRGTGPRGLAGIQPVRPLEEFILIRPLLDCWKEEILEFLRREKISFREDSSNILPLYLRNRIRRELLPLLEKYSPKVKESILRLAEHASDDYKYLKKQAGAAFKKLVCLRKDFTVRVDLRGLLKKNLALQKEVIREAVGLIKKDLRGIGMRHWQALDSLIKNAQSEGEISLPGGIIARKTRKEILFCRPQPKPPSVSPGRRYFPLKVPGRTRLSGLNLTVEGLLEKPKGQWRKKRSRYVEYFDFDRLKLPLTLRFRRPGDKIRPLGMKRRKRVKELFIDEKIPRASRERIPLVISGRKIIWVVGVKMAESVKVSPDTRKVLKIFCNFAKM